MTNTDAGTKHALGYVEREVRGRNREIERAHRFSSPARGLRRRRGTVRPLYGDRAHPSLFFYRSVYVRRDRDTFGLWGVSLECLLRL